MRTHNRMVTIIVRSFFEYVVVAFAFGSTMQSLTYAGIVGILDPPRPGVRESIQTVLGAGVLVKMITGDAEDTACTIGTANLMTFIVASSSVCLYTASRVGLFAYGSSSLSGDQIDKMSDHELEAVIGSVCVFYRAGPKHKLKIVKVMFSIPNNAWKQS